jgi:hypothetical protein
VNGSVLESTRISPTRYQPGALHPPSGTLPRRPGGAAIWGIACRAGGTPFRRPVHRNDRVVVAPAPLSSPRVCSDALGRPPPTPLDLLRGILPGGILHLGHNDTNRNVTAVIVLHFVGNFTGGLLGNSHEARSWRLLLTVALVVTMVRIRGPATQGRGGPVGSAPGRPGGYGMDASFRGFRRRTPVSTLATGPQGRRIPSWRRDP